MQKLIRWIFCCFFSLQLHATEGDALSFHPPVLPVPVETSFYLSHISSINEKTEVFFADVIFLFKWHDPRLAFQNSSSP